MCKNAADMRCMSLSSFNRGHFLAMGKFTFGRNGDFSYLQCENGPQIIPCPKKGFVMAVLYIPIGCNILSRQDVVWPEKGVFNEQESVDQCAVMSTEFCPEV